MGWALFLVELRTYHSLVGARGEVSDRFTNCPGGTGEVMLGTSPFSGAGQFDSIQTKVRILLQMDRHNRLQTDEILSGMVGN